MSLRGGLGEVLPNQKNQWVYTTYLESMDAIYHANGKDVWLLVGTQRPGSPQMIESFLITEQGVQGPVFSGPVSTTPRIIRFSHRDGWLVGGYHLYTFDNQTGQFQFFADLSSILPIQTWGAEFSDEDQMLYFSNPLGTLIQLDLTTPTPLSVINSVTTIHPGGQGSFFLGSRMELGPDDRIYLYNPISLYLAYISFPNMQGPTCQFVIQGVQYPNNYYFRSENLPAFVEGRYTNDRMEIRVSERNPCVGDEIKLWPHCTIGTYGFTYFINGDSLRPQRGDTLYYRPQHAGPLTITGRLESACVKYFDSQSVEVKPLPQFDLGPTQQLCGDSTLLDMSQLQNVSFLWSDSSMNPVLPVFQAGAYWVQVTENAFGCSSRDSIEILPPPLLIAPDLGEDTILCAGGSLLLQAQKGEGSIRWSDGSTDEMLLVDQSGLFWVEVRDTCGRVLRDSIAVGIRPPITLGITDSLFFCPGESVSIDASVVGYTNYRWEDGPAGPLRSFSSSGQYFLEAEDGIGCRGRDSITVYRFPDPPPMALAATDSLCAGDSLLLDARTEGLAFYLWDNGTSGPFRTVVTGGEYRLMGTDFNGCDTDTGIMVLAFEAIQPVLPEEVTFCREKIRYWMRGAIALFSICGWMG